MRFIEEAERQMPNLREQTWGSLLETTDGLHSEMMAISSADTRDIAASRAFRAAFETHRRLVDETLEPAVLERRATSTMRLRLVSTFDAVVTAAATLAADTRFGA